MPFTLSHPAVVLPLRRTGLPIAALTCGSMAPDLHIVVPRMSDTLTHSWVGVPTADVVLGLGLTGLWVLVLGPTMRAAAPAWVRNRLRPAPRYGTRQWLLAVVGVLIGAATHVGWDTFTHEEMWGGRNIPWLYQTHAGHPGYQWTQYASSIAGLAVVVVYVVLTLRRRTPVEAAGHPRARSARAALVIPFVAACALAVTAAALIMSEPWFTHDFVLSMSLRIVLVVSAVGAGFGAVVWCLLGRLRGGPGAPC